MEVSFTLWSMRDVLKNIPFDIPMGEAVHLDFSQMAVPFYVKDIFKVSIIYVDDTFPVDASCCIYSPKRIVTVVILMKRKFEDALSCRQTAADDTNLLGLCCRRRELYCHETAHLIAIIRAFPSDRYKRARDDFITKLRTKFEQSVRSAESLTSVPMISEEKQGDSPSVFDKDHFRYEGDSLNYFRLYEELMLSYDTLFTTLKQLYAQKGNGMRFEDISRATLVSVQFLHMSTNKKKALIDILTELS